MQTVLIACTQPFLRYNIMLLRFEVCTSLFLSCHWTTRRSENTLCWWSLTCTLQLSEHVPNALGSECNRGPNIGLGVCNVGAAGAAVRPELRRVERRLRHHRDVLRQAPVERRETLQPLGAHIQGTVVARAQALWRCIQWPIQHRIGICMGELGGSSSGGIAGWLVTTRLELRSLAPSGVSRDPRARHLTLASPDKLPCTVDTAVGVNVCMNGWMSGNIVKRFW